MKKTIMSVVAIAALAGAASAQTVTIGPFPLSGLQEVPAVTTPASGNATLTLNTATGAFSLDYSFSGLTGNLTVAHFHRNFAGVNGPVFYWLAANGAPNAGVTLNPPIPGAVTGATGTGTGTLPLAEVTNILQGRVYINIHSTAFGGGEIRGQVVPAPGALALVGLAGIAAGRRRRA